MEMTLNVPALLFPAVSLLMLAYTNKFLGLAAVIRRLHEDYRAEPRPIHLEQINHLRRRIQLIRAMQFFGIASLLLCTLCMFFLFKGMVTAGQWVFAGALVFMIVSLVISLMEIYISVGTLDMLLQDIENKNKSQ
jgi:uncharacterized membrane protein YgcG